MARDNHAAAERAALCDLLGELGPDQPTLCEGWRTQDLAAHLLVRERRPLSAAGIVVKPLAGHLERVQGRYAAQDFPRLVDTLRRLPSWSPLRLTAVDRAANTLEMFVHHEDVRRAQPEFHSRSLPADLERALWTRARGLARLQLRRFPATVTVESPGYGEATAGAGGPQVGLRGAPGELVLFLYGRQRVAEVELTGPDDLTARLRRARLGV